MMKKTLLFGIVFLFTLTSMTLPIHAEQSEITVEFREGDQPIDPVNPDNPLEPLFPGGGGGTGQSGPLTLNYVSPIAFGPQTITSTEQVYNALTLKPFVQVSDLRGNGFGWHLQATASPFTSTVGGNTLNGAFLTLTNPEALSTNMAIPAPNPNPNIVMPTDGTTLVSVFSAPINTGMGTWISRWYPSLETAADNDNVTLTIPAAVALIGVYTSTITWTLVDAP